MAIDFRANQIRVEKIISSGSTIIIYPSGAASDLAGTINTGIFPQTGFGSDVFLFVSGGVTRGGTSKNVSLFGGILVSSGAIYALAGLSGSHTKLADGTSYLIASGAVTIVTNSNGSITIGSTGGGASFSFNSTSIAYSGSSGLTGSGNFIFNDNTGTIKIFEAEDGLEITRNTLKVSDPTTETGAKDFTINGSNAIVSGSGGAITVNAGNSGYYEGVPNTGGAISLNAGSGSNVTDTFVQSAGTGGSITLTPGAGGSSYGTARGGTGGSLIFNGSFGGNSFSSYGGAGSNIYITAGSAGSGSAGSGLGGNIEITSGPPYFGFADADSGYLKLNVGYRTLSTTLSSASIRIDSDGFARNVIFGFDHISVGGITDSYFIVSGSPTRNALFMSDLISSASIKAITGFSGSHTKLVDGTSYLIAAGGITITTQSNGSIEISSSAGGSSLPSASNGSVLAYSSDTWAASNVGSLGQPLVSSGSGQALFSNVVAPLRIGNGSTATLDADMAFGLGYNYKAIKIRDFFNSTWLNIWSKNGSNYWTYGTTDATNSSGTILYAPSSANFYIYTGASLHFQISAGALTVGTTSDSTTIRGNPLTIGLTTVVATYQGGAKIPETTISSNTTLDASHEVVFVDASSAHVTASLPAGSTGRILSIQSISGSNDVVVVRGSSDTIRAYGTAGLTEYKISDNARRGLIFRSSGTEWVFEVA